MAGDMHIPDVQNIDSSMLSDVPGNVQINSAYDQQLSMSAIPTTSLSQEEEEEEKRRRALLLGMGVPLLGSLVVDGMPEAGNVPMVQGSPQVGGVPTVQGTPNPQAGSMGQGLYSSPTTMATQQPPLAPLSPLPTTTVTLSPPQHSHNPSNPPTPSPKPKGCSLALIIAAIIIPILILLSFIGVGLTLFAPSIGLSGSTTVVQGGTFTLEGSHFLPGSSVSLSLDNATPIYFVSRGLPDQTLSTTNSSMQLLTLDAQTTGQIALSNTTITVGGDGTFSVSITANPDWSIGKHTITAIESPTHRSTSIDITIYATGTTPTPVTTGGATPTPTSSQTASPTPTTTLTPTIAGLSCVNPSTLSLGPAMQGSNQPVTAQVSLCTSGNGTVNWTATWDQIVAPWLQLDHTSGQIIAPGQAQVTLSAVASNLAPGSHTVTVAFTSQPANTSQSLQVTFTVQGGCISGNPSTLSYNGVANVSDPNSQMVTISNCGPTGTWTAFPQTNNGGNWLFANKTTGTLNSGASSNIAISAFNLKAQLAAGTYTGSISFKIGSGTFIVHVTLTVTAAPTLSAKPLTIFANRQCLLGPTGGNWLCSVSLINNSTSVGLPWTARSSSGSISISPSNGFIQAGQSSTVQFSIPQSDCSPKGAGTITFTGPANAVTVAWNCIVG
jgi:hypothetical protein